MDFNLPKKKSVWIIVTIFVKEICRLCNGNVHIWLYIDNNSDYIPLYFTHITALQFSPHLGSGSLSCWLEVDFIFLNRNFNSLDLDMQLIVAWCVMIHFPLLAWKQSTPVLHCSRLSYGVQYQAYSSTHSVVSDSHSFVP